MSSIWDSPGIRDSITHPAIFTASLFRSTEHRLTITAAVIIMTRARPLTTKARLLALVRRSCILPLRSCWPWFWAPWNWDGIAVVSVPVLVQRP